MIQCYTLERFCSFVSISVMIPDVFKIYLLFFSSAGNPASILNPAVQGLHQKVPGTEH